jgi:hypothetical protein
MLPVLLEVEPVPEVVLPVLELALVSGVVLPELEVLG